MNQTRKDDLWMKDNDSIVAEKKVSRKDAENAKPKKLLGFAFDLEQVVVGVLQGIACLLYTSRCV